MKKKFVAGVAASALAGLLVTSAQANPSKGPLAGLAQIECSVTFDAFPQPVKSTNSTNCDGLATGNFTGLQANAPGGAVNAAAAGSPVSMTMQYVAPCVNGAMDFINGVITVSALTVVNVTKGGSLFVGPGTLKIPYTWQRAGANALITTGKNNPLFDPKKGSQTTLTWATGSANDLAGGAGSGQLIPEGVPSTACPGTPLTVQIVATLWGD